GARVRVKLGSIDLITLDVHGTVLELLADTLSVSASDTPDDEDADSAAKSLRCHVRAVSLLNQPEAWTAEMKPAGAAAPAP
ncbi:MAG TPA: RNB domain-containing ribonuclease, partial [Phycisphaerae bacterium]|nr:RNB domain-containing ribonuclease [Phycisphaerae bacterium]